jgi:hypothetical protein
MCNIRQLSTFLAEEAGLVNCVHQNESSVPLQQTDFEFGLVKWTISYLHLSIYPLEEGLLQSGQE